MSRRVSRASRQLFLVDLVTLMLLVLIVALRDTTAVDPGTPGQQDALVFRFQSVRGGDREVGEPLIGAAYVSDNHSIIAKPFDLTEEAGIVTFLSSGTTIFATVYEDPASMDDTASRILIYTLDRGQVFKPSMSIQCDYFNTFKSEWVPVFSSDSLGRLRNIEMMRDGILQSANALIEVSLVGVRRDGGATPVWQRGGG